MHVRLLALLVVAALAGVGAAWTSNPATAVTAAAAARIPPLPLPRPSASTLRCPLPARFRASFVHAARDTGLPLAMLVAVAEIESDFRADARSSADARGLLQVLPTTAASLQLDADEPASNVLAGARYLELLLERFQSADLALAAYNAGPTAVDAAGGALTAQTLTYVADVTARWRALTACNGS